MFLIVIPKIVTHGKKLKILVIHDSSHTYFFVIPSQRYRIFVLILLSKLTGLFVIPDNIIVIMVILVLVIPTQKSVKKWS